MINIGKINREIDYIRDFVDNEVHPTVTPNNWWVYSELCDLLDQLKIDINHEIELAERKEE